MAESGRSDQHLVVEWATSRGAATGRSQAEIVIANNHQVEALAEAWSWLCAQGLLARAVIHGNPAADAYFVTRRGSALLDESDPLAVVRAARRLGVELHPHLAPRLGPLVRAGAFEQAAFDALRQVEVRVADLAGHPTDKRGTPLRGVALMTEVFRDDGPLSDSAADPGEKRGVRELFSGAFGAVRNPLGHRNVEWTEGRGDGAPSRPPNAATRPRRDAAQRRRPNLIPSDPADSSIQGLSLLDESRRVGP